MDLDYCSKQILALQEMIVDMSSGNLSKFGEEVRTIVCFLHDSL
jgi:hypothetical protein